MSDVFEIGDIAVGEGKPVFVIAEVAQAHDGSLGMAHSFIDAIADAGADAVKFQTHIAAAETTPHEQWRVKFSEQDASRYDYWKRMEFAEAEWSGFKKHADERGLVFLSSAFSPEAVELLGRLGVAAWKVGSGEISNIPLLEQMAETGLPVLLSSGMSAMDEIAAAVDSVKEKSTPVGLFQCTSAYPCPPEKVGLNNISILRERFGCPLGLSDHSGEIYPGLSAVTLGADMLEVHVTFSKQMFGLDASSSLTFEQLRQLVDGVRFTEKMNSAYIDKDSMAGELGPLRDLFTKSVVARRDLPAGTVLVEGDTVLKKPGTGIPANQISEVLGKKLIRDIKADDLLAYGDLEQG